MIKSTKSISAFFIFILCLIFSAKYLQNIFREKDLYISTLRKFNGEKNICNPKDDSLISFFEKNKKNVVIVIFDGFPNPSVFKDLTGYNSKLHDFLKNKSSESIYVSGASHRTYSSLPNLLGKIPLKNKCRYPFFSGAVNSNIILNSNFVATNKAVCKDIYDSVSNNNFVRMKYLVRRKIDKNYNKKVQNTIQNCAFKNEKTLDLIVTQLNSQVNQEKGSLNIIHDIQYIKDGDKKIVFLPDFEREYLNSINYLIKRLKETKKIDELIIMNDHGPNIKNKLNKYIYKDSRNLTLGSLEDDNFYGVFASRFSISENNNQNNNLLFESIPNSKERYCDDDLGNLFKIDNLSELDDCYE